MEKFADVFDSFAIQDNYVELYDIEHCIAFHVFFLELQFPGHYNKK